MHALRSIHSICVVALAVCLGALLAGAQTSGSAINYYQRANARMAAGDLDGAIDDYGIAITFEQSCRHCYIHRGAAR